MRIPDAWLSDSPLSSLKQPTLSQAHDGISPTDDHPPVDMLVVPMDDASAARGRFLYIMFMFLLFMMFSPNPPNPHRIGVLETLATMEKHSLEVIRNATYKGPFEIPRSLNLTGVHSLL